MWRFMNIGLIIGLILSVHCVHGTTTTTTKVARFVPRRSPMLPQDGNMDLAMQSRAADTRVQLSIKEGLPIGTLVGTIPVQQNFTYRFNEPPDEFVLDPDSGQIRTAKVIDREALPSDKFDLVVLSSQPTHPIEVRIHVLDVNDNDPEFPEPNIAVSFSESAVAGTKLLLDAATDKDTTDNGVADDYFIVDGNSDGKFRLDVTWNLSGENSYLHLETTGKLDREQTEFYSLNVCARDRGKPPRLGYLLVNVTVLDVNDNPPIFQQSDYVVTLNESVPVGTKVLTVKASDKDTDDNARLTYYLTDTETQFTIDPESGTIKTAEPLYCPQHSCNNNKFSNSCPKSCVITVFARDHGSPRQDGRTYVTVNLLDANDHDPEIKFNYFPPTVGFATVDENAMKDSLVAAVAVIDNDEGLNGETTVEIKGGNELGHFRLDNTQNFDIVRVNGRLDREEIPRYNLTIVATDKGTPPRSATAYLVIHVNDVNDHDPVFKQSEYTSILSELSPIGTFVASISAIDADSGLNARIYYDFDSGNEQSWFAIDPDTGLVTTITQLDREVQGTVELSVTARDGGPNPRFASTYLRVTVLDENDEAPKFVQSVIEITLSENIPPHNLVATLTAIDNDQGTNGSVAYSLHPSVYRDYPKTFTLDALTGQLTTKASLDRETIGEYRILVIAKDQGTPPQSSTATVVLILDDENDNVPVFYPTKYFFAIPEDTPLSTSIGKVTATDADKDEYAEIRYSLLSGGDGLFSVDEKNGDIYLQASLRFAPKTLFKLIVSAKDMGDRESVEKAVVEVMRKEDLENLDFDMYSGYDFKITEDHGDCSEITVNFDREVGLVMVTQFPRNKITYSIVYGDPSGNFKINEFTGAISTNKCLDREQDAYYTLKIVAKAGLARATTFVNVTVQDVNDNPPKFWKGDKADEFYLKENAAVGQEVYLARARDRDVGVNARISYTLSYNPGGQFRIAENSGIIYLDKPIRAPPGTILNLEVTAVDSGLQPLSAQHQVRVIIEDVNDHTPVFKLTTYETSLPESTLVNERFFSLIASDADLGNNGQILYNITNGNDENRFGIFPDGQLYVKHDLDREKQDYYVLEVSANDQGKPSRSSIVAVIVHIIDENDNAPQFTNSTFIFHIQENEPPQTFIGKLLATDKDIGRNADLTFSLPVTQQDLYVDPTNGFIKSLHVYDREELVANTGTNYISLEATVMDNGINRLRDKVKVTIYITDINDNAPQFQRLPYRVQVSEGAVIGTQLLRVYTSDADEGLNGDVFYSLTDGNQDNQFVVDEATGQISLARELDRETRDHYLLTVVAHDAGLDVRLSSSVTVNIDILDENDNAPKFINNKSQISIIENTPINSELLQFKATDDDLDSNGDLTFGISSGNRRDTFYIDPITGILYLKKPLDYEELESYTLNITCSDGGHPKMSSITSLRVDVIDANDNPPVFPHTAIVRQIREGITVRTPVHSVTAEDPDSGENGAVTYAIASQDPDDQKRYFGINPLTGVIHTLLPIDREEVDTFKLVVVATDRAQPASARLSAEKLVIVIVEDLNDNAPIFVNMLAVVLPPLPTLNTIDEIPVARLIANDLDSGTNGLVTYELMRSEANYLDMFKIHRSTGVLIMKLPQSLNSLERSFRYQVGVRATDEAVQAERRSSETYIALIVPGDVNDGDRPIWDHKGLLEGSVYENEPAGTSILKVNARIYRSGVDIEYYVTNVTAGISGTQVDRLFDIDMKSGLLQTAGPLDREIGIDWYEVEIYAVVIGGDKPSTSSIKVRVTVLDKNDVAPSWGPGPWKFNVSEEAPPNTIVTTLKAFDPDTISTLRYTLIPTSQSNIHGYYDDQLAFNNQEQNKIEKQFLLDSHSGQLKLIQTLDREITEKYVLRVRADDGLQHTDINLIVKVMDTNDNAPIFQSVVYSFDIAEDVPHSKRIGQVVATDADAEGPNSQLSYALISDWANDVFSLNPTTGVFTLTAPLDYEQVQHYILVVQATDGGSPALSTTVTVYCNVIDLNDNAPIFQPGPRGTEIYENVTIGTSVLSVVAQDLDSGDNGHVVYDIIDGDENNDFGIAPNGTIYSRKLLDREAKVNYNLIIRARDSPQFPQKSLSSSLQVTIVLLDINDVAPEFISENHTLFMENSALNTVVMAVKAVDKDEGRNGYVEYFLDDPSSSFTLGNVDGLLRVSKILDRERRQNYTLKVTAKDRGEPVKSAETMITINILDENDNSPIFDPKQYSATVAENASIGVSVLQVFATDRDEGANGRVRFSIALGDENRDFTISEDGGVIRVAKNLNYERKSKYNLTVKVEDCATEIGGISREDNVEVRINILDINDNAPLFPDSPYLVNVMENMVPNGGLVTQVKAHDADSPPYNDQVRYFLKEGDTDLFKINASTGDIFLLRPLDRESVPEYTLTLVAMDTGSPPLTGAGILKIVVLDVNDHSPEFSRSQYRASVTENLPPGTWVSKPTAIDKDDGLNAEIRYSLLGEKTEQFSVNPKTGVIETLVSLDRELTSVYHLTLIAQDSSLTGPRATAVNLTIFVEDVNDNSPKFSSSRYTAYIPDSTKSGDFVFGAKATDDDDGENSRIIYYLQGKDANLFVIDTSNGVIRAATDSLNSKTTYQLQIQASDAGEPSHITTTDLIIHLWERRLFPSFRSSMMTNFTFPEDTPGGKLITTLSASTPKVGAASNLVFAIAGGNIGDALKIDAQSGDVLVASGFDFETAPIYEAWVEVRDSDNPPLRSVIQLLINVTDTNDNPPVMETSIYNASVIEEEYSPLYVSKVNAVDADSGENGQVSYYLLNNFDESFIIEENTGEISTNAKLDREEIDCYVLIVEARDHGQPTLSGTATVMVTVLDKNDNPPRFTRLFSVNVTENSDVGTFVIRITSSDQDIGDNANVTYSFIENPGSKFSIDSSTGIVEVIGYLDREVQDEYLLKVGAADGAWVSSTTLTITIQDQNDNAPEFTEDSYYFNFPELQKKLTHVGQVFAIDRDKQGPNSVISYGFLHPSDFFYIDPATGDIFNKRTLHYKHTYQKLSPENSYPLTVVATDNGKPPLSTSVVVHINIVNANNNAPNFEQTSYLSPVPEDYGVNRKITKLTALDSADFGVNAEIEYSISNGNISDYFGIDPKTGWVFVAKSLYNVPIGSVFFGNVQAVDKGIPPLKAVVPVTLIITGENRYPPTFAAVSYQVRIPENEPINTTILTVSAVDGDSGPNGMIRYNILAESDRQVFSINPITGAIAISQVLDYDVIQEYRLKITATDLGFKPQTSVATLTINVSDINDNPPTFNQTLFEAFLPENSAPNTFVYKVEAKDIDSPKYAIIQYRIIGGSGKDHFQINQDTGVITSRVSLNYEETELYILDIAAANPDSNPQMVGFTRVVVHITGVNEYYPKFIQPVFHLDVSESTEIGTSIGLVQATDQDAGEDGKVYYLLVGSSNDKGFSIGSETGIISVARRLDRETQNRVILSVMAKNSGGIRGNDVDEAQVIISIQDGNDPPEFLQSHYKASISEGAYPGTRVLTVRAIDKDVKPQNNQFSYSIMGGNIGQTFKIDPHSGDIETAKTLDRETVPSYQLYIGAIDTGSPPETGTVTVQIDLLDINDNAPIFDPPNIVGYVMENEPIGTSIMTLAATDLDLPPNGAPFTYRLIGGRETSYVMLDKRSGVLKTMKIFDREAVAQLNLLIEVEDSGVPKLKNEHQVTIVVLDENDNPSSSRSVHVLVHSLNGHTPMGKIADVHPNDPDTTGDYTCKILEASNPGVLSIPIACDLHTNKITPGLGYSLTVSGNDGRHTDVVSRVTVEFLVFSNATVDNSIVLQITKLIASEFLAKYYRPLLDMLQDDLDAGDTIVIYSIGEMENNLDVYIAIETTQGFKTKSQVSHWLHRNKKKIQQLLDGNTVNIGYSPCQYASCENGGVCSNQIMVYNDAQIINSQNFVFTSPKILNQIICKCREGFTGDLCEKRQDPCSPNPCFEEGKCRRIGYDFACSCPLNRSGKLCELERGDACASNPCKNGGSCQVSPDGANFFCLCRAGYRGNQCEVMTDSCRPNPCHYGGLCVSQKPEYHCSCPEGRYGRHCERSTYGFDELSFMTFPSLDSTTNDITIVFSTIKPDALFLYNYGAQSSGRSDFIVLELIAGKITFSYGGARSAITTITINGGGRLDDGQWQKVTATRNGRVVSLSVSSCREHGDICDDCRPGDESCYADDIGPIGTLNFNSNPFLLGGLVSADPILERPGQIHSDDLVGCIHSVSINGRALNLSNPITSRGVKNTCPRPVHGLCSAEKEDTACGATNKCFDKWHQVSCQCGPVIAPNCQDALEPINLSEDGFIEFKISEKHKRMQLLESLYGGTTSWFRNRVTRATQTTKSYLFSQSSVPPKKISLMFRTIKSNGILIYAATNKHHTLIELKNGQLSYTSLLGTAVNMTGYVETGLADGRWHNLTVITYLREVRVLVDGILTGDELDSAGVHDFLDPYLTSLFIGGVKRELFYYDILPNKFEGCLANFTINDELQPFNGSGSIFRNVVYHGNILRGCRGPIGISAATAADPLSIGITLVIVFFVTLLIAILVSFIVFRLRRQSKEKATSVVSKSTNAIMSGNSLVTTGNDGMIARHENTYITDSSDLRGVGHIGPELISKKFKEREINNTEHRPQRPDIIEREVTKSSPIRDEHPLLPPPTSSLHSHEHNNEPDMPEHYDLENASSIAPSDIDIVYHYKGYRDGMRKYKATPPPMGSYSNHHKHTGTPHRHVGPFPPRSMPPPSVGQSSGPSPKLLQSTPLARLSPSSELSAQQPRILTLHDISGKPLQSALLATTSSSGGVGKDVLNSNSERSLNSPIMSQLSGSTASRKAPQSANDNGNNVGPPMGLTAEEIERLNSRPRTSSLVSTLDAVSSSSEARGPPPPPHGPLHLHRRHSPPQKRLERRNSSTTDESENDSFTCSEIEYDSNSLVGDKRTSNLYNKPENEEEEVREVAQRTNESPQSPKPPLPPNVNVYDNFDSSFRGSLSTLVASDDDLSTHMGSLYRPTNNGSPSANTALSWDYLLNWGPNFENLIGVFVDIAELPDSTNRVSNNLRLPTSTSKSSEEYV